MSQWTGIIKSGMLNIFVIFKVIVKFLLKRGYFVQFYVINKKACFYSIMINNVNKICIKKLDNVVIIHITWSNDGSRCHMEKLNMSGI